MNNFSRGKQFDGGRSFGGNKNNGRSMMHKSTCSKCGNECNLPFRPTGNRPVFCSSCFEQDGGGNRPNKFNQEQRPRRSHFEDKQMHDAECAKCKAKCQVPFKPSPGKQVFCDNCFDRNSKGSANYDEQFKTLNEKLDRLIKILIPNVPAEKSSKKKNVKKVKNDIKIEIPVKKSKKNIKEKSPRKKKTKK